MKIENDTYDKLKVIKTTVKLWIVS